MRAISSTMKQQSRTFWRAGHPSRRSLMSALCILALMLGGCNGGSASDQPTLSWSAPMTRADGSALRVGQIESFKIYYRLRHEQTFRLLGRQDSTVTRYRLPSLPPGAYEFAISTVDTEGLESRRSEPVSVDLI